MTTLANSLTPRNSQRVRHYAHLGDVWGIATLTPGGYVFRADGTGDAQLVSYRAPELFLHGLVDEESDEDPRPLWQQVADPATYNGSYRRDLVQGH